MRRDIQKQQWTGRRWSIRKWFGRKWGSLKWNVRKWNCRSNRVKWTTYLIPAVLGLVFLIGVGLVISYQSDEIRSVQTAGELDGLRLPAGQRGQEMGKQDGLQFPAGKADQETREQDSLDRPEKTAGQEEVREEASYTAATKEAIRTTASTMLPRHDFAALKEKNEDIMAWITIPGMLNEPVVQRDNVFYMNHDAIGRENGNGAIFMDAWGGFQEDRQTLILYGHNMRSGQMFGRLWQYENETFWKENATIYLDLESRMEEYSVFAAGRFGIEESMPNYLNILDLCSKNMSHRLEAMRRLIDNSAIDGGMAREDEQVLVLITCVDEENERRYVAARLI